MNTSNINQAKTVAKLVLFSKRVEYVFGIFFQLKKNCLSRVSGI